MIPDKDDEIGLHARRFLSTSKCAYVLVVDDLEQSRAGDARQVFERYRKALDTILSQDKQRAAVHFLVNMLGACRRGPFVVRALAR